MPEPCANCLEYAWRLQDMLTDWDGMTDQQRRECIEQIKDSMFSRNRRQENPNGHS
jgi:predicted Fe-S protein YdhL (DUF1289 family)